MILIYRYNYFYDIYHDLKPIVAALHHRLTANNARRLLFGRGATHAYNEYAMWGIFAYAAYTARRMHVIEDNH